MAKCDVCGNQYGKTFQVMMNGETHTFDSFECAIHALTPICTNCGVTIVGQGVEAYGDIYCGANCAESQGVTELKDRVKESVS